MTQKKDYAKSFSSSFQLVPSKTVLLIVDMQYATGAREEGLGKILKEQGREEEGQWRFNRIEQVVIPNIKKLLDKFRNEDLKVIYITLGSEKEDFSDLPPHVVGLVKATNNKKGNRTHEIRSEIEPETGEKIINKTTFSAFISTNINDVLQNMGAEYLLFAGISTNTCVESTARDAADYGYRCVIVENACGAAAEKWHTASLENFARLFGRVASIEDVLSEL